MKRCPWAVNDELMIKYHDEEWGVPVHNDKKLFEFMILDAFQAGLSWKIILHKRDAFRKAFDDFDYTLIAEYGDDKIDELLQNKSIIRNKLKIKAAVTNAQAFTRIIQEFKSFDDYIWGFTNNKTVINQFRKYSCQNNII